MQTKQIQLWPGGRLLRVAPDEIGYRIVEDDGRVRTPNDEEARDLKIHDLAEQYAGNEIYVCDSSLVDDAMKISSGRASRGDFAHEWTEENIVNLYPDPDEWTMEQCREWFMENGWNDAHLGIDPWNMSRDQLVEALHERFDHPDEPAIVAQASDETLRNALIEDMNDETIEGIDRWRGEIRDRAQAAEIFEWWRVSRWFADLLIEIGECVMDNAYGTWWGRCTTGQSYIMDGVLQRAAARHLERSEPKRPVDSDLYQAINTHEVEG